MLDQQCVLAFQAGHDNQLLHGCVVSNIALSVRVGAEGNIRDNATMEQLVVMSSLESQNALLIQQKMSQSERLVMLNTLARSQLTSLLSNPSIKSLENKPLLN